MKNGYVNQRYESDEYAQLHILPYIFVLLSLLWKKKVKTVCVAFRWFYLEIVYCVYTADCNRLVIMNESCLFVMRTKIRQR